MELRLWRKSPPITSGALGVLGREGARGGLRKEPGEDKAASVVSPRWVPSAPRLTAWRLALKLSASSNNLHLPCCDWDLIGHCGRAWSQKGALFLPQATPCGGEGGLRLQFLSLALLFSPASLGPVRAVVSVLSSA